METAYEGNGTFLGKFAEVFGDPTRRAMYQHLLRCGDPQTASEVAEPFCIHRTVARAHLEKLRELGLVEAGTRRRPGGGRPAKTYATTTARLEISVPPRRYEILAELLLGALEDSLGAEAATAAAERLGRVYGEQTALEIAGEGAHPPLSLSPAAVVSWMASSGYDAALVGNGGGSAAIEVHNCVYRELAEQHAEVICGFDCGMLCGMLGCDAAAHTQTRSLVAGDEYCRHEYAL